MKKLFFIICFILCLFLLGWSAQAANPIIVKGKQTVVQPVKQINLQLSGKQITLQLSGKQIIFQLSGKQSIVKLSGKQIIFQPFISISQTSSEQSNNQISSEQNTSQISSEKNISQTSSEQSNSQISSEQVVPQSPAGEQIIPQGPAGEQSISQTSLVYSTQTIDFVTGWNSFSTYFLPRYMTMATIIQPLLNEGSLIVVDDKEGHTIVASGTSIISNNIYNITIGHGYWIKTNKQTSLTIQGTPFPLPYALQLHSGRNTIGYMGNTGATALCVIKPLINSGNFTIMKDEAGNVLWLYDTGANGLIDNIGMMKPGEGYQLLVNFPQVLNFNANYGTCSLAPAIQTFNLQTGRNNIGINIIPTNPDPNYIFSSLLGSFFIIKDGNANTFTSYNGVITNMLGNLQVGRAYKVYVNNPINITFTGEYMTLPYNLSLVTGYNLISFNASKSADALCVFGSQINQSNGPILNVSDMNNNVVAYIPGLGEYNGIGDLLPGEIYNIYTNQATSITIADSYNCN